MVEEVKTQEFWRSPETNWVNPDIELEKRYGGSRLEWMSVQ